MKYNASDHTTKGILLQKELNEKLHLITYYLSSMSSIKRNYIIYNKELLTIIRYFKK